MKNKLAEFRQTILMLSGESTVPPELLLENPTLVQMVKDEKPYEELLAYVNENW